MEKVRINGIEKKDSGLVIVNYNENKEATLNTKWQAQEVDYLEKDVGIGGECSVGIVVKGQYTNITKVDMASAVKGHGLPNQEVHTEGASLMSQRDVSIIAQTMMKAFYYGNKAESVEEVYDRFNAFKKLLEING